MKCYMTGRPCDHYKKYGDEKHIFILTPFGFPYDSFYSQDQGIIWKFLQKEGFSPSRADQTLRIGLIMCQSICKQIIANELMLVDISIPNPNVYYELGLAYGIGRSVLLCANRDTSNEYLDLFNNLNKENEKVMWVLQTIMIMRRSYLQRYMVRNHLQ